MQSRPGAISAIIQLANPVFIACAIVIPIGALIIALNLPGLLGLNYVHVLTGVLWTGIDLFMGIVIGPVLGRLEPRDRAAVFRRLIPRMTFLMPVLAGVATTSGINLAQHMSIFSLSNPRILAAIIISALLALQGFGILLPNEIRIFRQLLSQKPDIERIARLGMVNARLSGLQGLFQLAIIFIMATIRF